jgi:hypothetical protein
VGKIKGLALVASLLFLGCASLQTQGTATTHHPDGSVTSTEFKKGLLDDMDLPTTGVSVRVGPSKVAADALVKMYGMTGEGLRQLALERAAQQQKPK